MANSSPVIPVADSPQSRPRAWRWRPVVRAILSHNACCAKSPESRLTNLQYELVRCLRSNRHKEASTFFAECFGDFGNMKLSQKSTGFPNPNHLKQGNDA
jgi:hypothetical protein